MSIAVGATLRENTEFIPSDYVIAEFTPPLFKGSRCDAFIARAHTPRKIPKTDWCESVLAEGDVPGGDYDWLANVPVASLRLHVFDEGQIVSAKRVQAVYPRHLCGQADELSLTYEGCVLTKLSQAEVNVALAGGKAWKALDSLPAPTTEAAWKNPQSPFWRVAALRLMRETRTIFELNEDVFTPADGRTGVHLVSPFCTGHIMFVLR